MTLYYEFMLSEHMCFFLHYKLNLIASGDKIYGMTGTDNLPVWPLLTVQNKKKQYQYIYIIHI